MKLRVGLALGAVIVAGAVGGLATARQAREAPGVSLAHELVAAASAFETYSRGAATISPGFDGGASVGAALVASAAYNPDQLEAGMVAYGAIAALQEPAFLDGVRDAALRLPREDLIARLTEQPESVVEIDGAGAAASRAQFALRQRGEPIGAVGRAVKQAAYDVQHQAWSTGLIGDTAGRLARVKAAAAARFVPGDEDAGRLIQAATARGDREQGAEGAAFTPITVRAAALAALAVLGAAGDDDMAHLAPVLHEQKAGYCLKMAKLNLYQCLAVAGPHYEDVFCLGQHALIDTAQCVTDAAGGSAAATGFSQVATAPRSKGFTIPVAASARMADRR